MIQKSKDRKRMRRSNIKYYRGTEEEVTAKETEGPETPVNQEET